MTEISQTSWAEERLDDAAGSWTDVPASPALLGRIVAAVPARRRRRRQQRAFGIVSAVGAVALLVGLTGGLREPEEPYGSIRVGATRESFRSEANETCRSFAAERLALVLPEPAAPIEDKVAYIEQTRRLADREIAAIGALSVPEEDIATVAAMLADAAESTRLFDELLPAYVRTLETGDPLPEHERVVARELDEVSVRIEAAIVALGLTACTGGA